MAVLLGAMVALAAGLDIAVPFITRRLIDGLVTTFNNPQSSGIGILVSCGFAILAATALTRGVRSFYNYGLFRTVAGIEDDLRHAAFDNYLRQHALYHRNANSGQIIGRIDAGSTAVFSVLYDICGQSLVPPIITITGVLISLASMNAWVALAVVLPIPVYLATVRRLTRRIYEIEQQGCEQFEAVGKERYDVAANAVTVKRFSQEQAELVRQRVLLERARRTQFRGDRLWIGVENLQNLISTVGRVAVIFLAGWLVFSKRATVGDFVLFVALSDMAYQPIAQLSILLPRMRRSVARAERLFDVLDDRPEVTDRPGAVELAPLETGIEFLDVWFRYDDASSWTVKGVNLAVPAGSTVALVGRSGSGKTTLTNLLMRMFDPQKGAILIDRLDIRDASQESLRRQVAVVPQETDLFSRTIAENIAYGRPDATQAEIEAAARLALAHEFIMRTEHGYQTVVGERGLKLSGGERQRIGIARAILRNPSILILDEATSHLDTESERLIQEATERVVKGRTSFIVAHRLSTILYADMIVVFHRGAIEAVGTHEELLETSATYRRLYALYSEDRRPAHRVGLLTADPS